MTKHSTRNLGRLKAAAATAVMLGAASSANAAGVSIALNFVGAVYGQYNNPGGFGASVTAPAFGVAVSDWTTSPIPASDGAGPYTVSMPVNGILYKWSYSNTWALGGSPSGASPGDGQVLFGQLDDGGSGADITIDQGLSSWLANIGATSYSVTVIMATADTQYNAFAMPALLNSSGGSSLGTFTSPTPQATSGGEWGTATITGLTSDSLFIDGQRLQGVARGSIAGVILSAVPEPGVSILGAVAGLGLFLRRRR